MSTVAGIRLFELDPDLLALIPERDADVARRIVVVPSVRVPTGTWDQSEIGSPRWGAVVLAGLVARQVVVAGTAAAELVGAGDVVNVDAGSPDEVVASTAEWTVLEALHLALLDDRFGQAVRRWPELSACLLQRTERRAARLAVYQAISHLTRVDTRVLVMLWTLAGRWGRVTPDGIALPLRLTHRTLARLVGARRPSVTTAMTELSRRNLVVRRDDGSWLLHGPPPEELECVGVDRILSRPAPPPRSAPVTPLPSRAREADDAIGAHGADERRLAAEHARAEARRMTARMQTTLTQIGALAEAYELQAEQTRAASSRTRELREEITAARRRRLGNGR